MTLREALAVVLPYVGHRLGCLHAYVDEGVCSCGASTAEASAEAAISRAESYRRYARTPGGLARYRRYGATPRGLGRYARYDGTPRGWRRHAQYAGTPRGHETGRRSKAKRRQR